MELISGEHVNGGEYTEDIDSAAKDILAYSNQEITRKIKASTKRMMVSAVSVCLLVVLLIPALNGLIWGDGFAWRCIPAYLCAQKAAEAIETGDEQGIRTYIGNSDGMFEALWELHQQGVDIWEAEAKFLRTRLDDMFLRLEVELVVMYKDIKYQFTCNGTYRNGKVEFMNIVNPSVGQDYPEWILQLSDALSTYDPG